MAIPLSIKININKYAPDPFYRHSVFLQEINKLQSGLKKGSLTDPLLTLSAWPVSL
ncbi:hypothetical protein [Citrobacter amalonaticus]|uniref:hypothetical protein n=1 Tax=Citrobacter amalonaticus TaxID=35703 RepID=UPI0015E17935|nr:hypothetical protein [Citrobacter amalonaticus]